MILKKKTVKCRKRHRCFYCGEWAEIGTEAISSSWMTEEGFVSGYFHIECDEAIQKSKCDSFEEFEGKRGIPIDEYHEPMTPQPQS